MQQRASWNKASLGYELGGELKLSLDLESIGSSSVCGGEVALQAVSRQWEADSWSSTLPIPMTESLTPGDSCEASVAFSLPSNTALGDASCWFNVRMSTTPRTKERRVELTAKITSPPLSWAPCVGPGVLFLYSRPSPFTHNLGLLQPTRRFENGR